MSSSVLDLKSKGLAELGAPSGGVGEFFFSSQTAFLHLKRNAQIVESLEQRFRPGECETMKTVLTEPDLHICVDSKRWYVGCVDYSTHRDGTFTVVVFPRSREDRRVLLENAKNLVPFGPSDKFPEAIGVIRALVERERDSSVLEVGMVQTCLSFGQERSAGYKAIPQSPADTAELRGVMKSHFTWREESFAVLCDMAQARQMPIGICIDLNVDFNLAKQLVDREGNYRELCSQMITTAVDHGYVSVRAQNSRIKLLPRSSNIDIPRPHCDPVLPDSKYTPSNPFRAVLSLETEVPDTYYADRRALMGQITQDDDANFSNSPIFEKMNFESLPSYQPSPISILNPFITDKINSETPLSSLSPTKTSSSIDKFAKIIGQLKETNPEYFQEGFLTIKSINKL